MQDFIGNLSISFILRGLFVFALTIAVIYAYIQMFIYAKGANKDGFFRSYLKNVGVFLGIMVFQGLAITQFSYAVNKQFESLIMQGIMSSYANTIVFATALIETAAVALILIRALASCKQDRSDEKKIRKFARCIASILAIPAVYIGLNTFDNMMMKTYAMTFSSHIKMFVFTIVAIGGGTLIVAAFQILAEETIPEESKTYAPKRARKYVNAKK